MLIVAVIALALVNLGLALVVLALANHLRFTLESAKSYRAKYLELEDAIRAKAAQAKPQAEKNEQRTLKPLNGPGLRRAFDALNERIERESIQRPNSEILKENHG